MSIVTKNYKVEYVISNSSFTDITDFVYSLDEFILQSTGKISSAKITLNSEFGNFITNTNEDATPIISQFDLIRISIIGDDGLFSEDATKVFEVTTDLSQNQGRSSYLLPIEMEGRERNLAGVPFGAFLRNATHKEILVQIRAAYNEQIKSSQPALTELSSSDVPDFNPNFWDFTQVDNCYDAFLAVVDNLDLPVDAGGGGNRYGLVFVDEYTTYPTTIDLDSLQYKVIIQGSANATIPTLLQNTTHPIRKIDRIKQASTGSVVVARGRPKTSMLPQNYPTFISKLEFYINIKLWDITIAYPVDSYVSWEQNVGGYPQKYQANAQTTAGDEPGISSNWTTITVGDYIGDIQYSPFTQDKRGPILNGFANPTGSFDTTSTDAVGIPDHNLVINDVDASGSTTIGTYRNWVIHRTNDSDPDNQPSSAQNYLWGSSGAYAFYEGFRVLVDSAVGTLSNDFAGSDSNGVTFDGNIAEYRATVNTTVSSKEGEWFVVRETQDFDECAIYSQGKLYEYNVSFATADRVYPGVDRRRGGSTSGTFAWREINEAFMGNECFHNPISVENGTGLVADNTNEGEPLIDPDNNNYNDNSSIVVTFGYNQANETQDERNVWFKIDKTITTALSIVSPISTFLTNLTQTVFDTFTTPQYTNMGWWFAWPVPYPLSIFNGITEDIGELYGGIDSTLNNHRYFDLFNIQYTTTGLRGWTNDDSSDLSEITGVEFLFNFDITIASTRIPFTGDVPFAYWCIDDNGTVWKSPKIMYRHLGETQQIKIEFGDLSPVFRGRTPLGIDNVLENIIVGEVEINEVFFKDKVVFQGFQCETPYDEFGRYSPNLFEQIIKPVFFDIFSGGNSDVRFIGKIDAYGFTKTPIAISSATTFSSERTIIPQFEDFHNIVNIEQLQRYADSAVEVEQFQYEQYTIEQSGITDLALEDSIYLSDPYMISESDSGSDNTRLLAVREIHYSVPADSGLIRKLIGVKVITT